MRVDGALWMLKMEGDKSGLVVCAFASAFGDHRPPASSLSFDEMEVHHILCTATMTFTLLWRAKLAFGCGALILSW